MVQYNADRELAEISNYWFDKEVFLFLRQWIAMHQHQMILRFKQPMDEYLVNDALRDFFLNTENPLSELLKNQVIARHLGRRGKSVYFDPINGDPLLAFTEQRIYNLARRMGDESMHVPFRSIHPGKQNEAGDIAGIDTYPVDSETVRYNSGNHFTSRPANSNVFDENSKRCTAKAEGNLHVLFKRGFLEERLQEVKALAALTANYGEIRVQFFVVCSRHSLKEGHFGASLVIMDPANPDFPKRVLVCDTLLKELPHHPRWWHHFVTEFSNVFGNAVAEFIEDISHPLQKVNVKGDEPYRHDWDCPYYVASMADALAELVKADPELLLNGDSKDIHQAMKAVMTDYYQDDLCVKDRVGIKMANRTKRWRSGRRFIKDLLSEINQKKSYDL